jgi:hypothetical protein
MIGFVNILVDLLDVLGVELNDSESILKLLPIPL